jgi:hypothetical protein
MHYVTMNAPTSVGTHKIYLPYPVTCAAGATWTLTFNITLAAPGTIGYAFSNGDYAGGSITQYFGTGVSVGDDLTFAIYSRTALGFNSSVSVQATDSAAESKVAQIDYLVRVPTDEGYICINRYFAAGQGVMVDESSPLATKHNAYLCDTDGIGPSVLAQATEWRGSLMLRPGDNTYVLAAHTPAAAAPGGADVWVWYRPRYLTCGS